MKKLNLTYWIITGLFGAFMFFTAVPNLLTDVESVAFINDMLGYPEYIIPFLGVAKILGVIAILVPGFPLIKEWAYAGFSSIWRVQPIRSSLPQDSIPDC